MPPMLHSIASLLRSLVALAMLGLVAAAGWLGYERLSAHSALESELRQRKAEVDRLSAELSASEKQLQQVELALRLLKRDHRLAKVTVLRQWQPQDAKHPRTQFRFDEIDDEDRTIGEARTFTIDGDILYIEAWIVKYLDRFVEGADPLRGTSVCLFKRLYGEFQEPRDGFAIDRAGSRPAAYTRGGHMPEGEKEIWAKFWEFANDPEKAEKAGIRAVHGDAPFVQLRPGKAYRVELRASDGLSIKAQETSEASAEKL